MAESMTDEIEVSRMSSLVAETSLERDETGLAERMIERALKFADTSDLQPELAAALLMRGRLHESRKDWEQCFADYRRALQVHKTIATSIPIGEDAQRYQGKRHVQFLAAGIQRLSKLLG
jgi:hypothetical protein